MSISVICPPFVVASSSISPPSFFLSVSLFLYPSPNRWAWFKFVTIHFSPPCYLLPLYSWGTFVLVLVVLVVWWTLYPAVSCFLFDFSLRSFGERDEFSALRDVSRYHTPYTRWEWFKFSSFAFFFLSVYEAEVSNSATVLRCNGVLPANRINPLLSLLHDTFYYKFRSCVWVCRLWEWRWGVRVPQGTITFHYISRLVLAHSSSVV